MGEILWKSTQTWRDGFLFRLLHPCVCLFSFGKVSLLRSETKSKPKQKNRVAVPACCHGFLLLWGLLSCSHFRLWGSWLWSWCCVGHVCHVCHALWPSWLSSPVYLIQHFPPVSAQPWSWMLWLSLGNFLASLLASEEEDEEVWNFLMSSPLGHLIKKTKTKDKNQTVNLSSWLVIS